MVQWCCEELHTFAQRTEGNYGKGLEHPKQCHWIFNLWSEINIFWRRIGWTFSYSEFPNNCFRRQILSYQPLQFGRGHFHEVPHQSLKRMFWSTFFNPFARTFAWFAENSLRSLDKSEFLVHIKRNTIGGVQGCLKQQKAMKNLCKKEQFSDPNSDPNCHILRLIPPWKIHRIEPKSQTYKHIERIWRIEINFSEFKSLLLRQKENPTRKGWVLFLPGLVCLVSGQAGYSDWRRNCFVCTRFWGRDSPLPPEFCS